MPSYSNQLVMFYTYRQNNTFGEFKISETLDQFVVIEASSASEADEKAEQIGIYFHGVAKGHDCDCCGDRWWKATEHNGYPYPSRWGEEELSPDDMDEVVIHYADGRVSRRPDPVPSPTDWERLCAETQLTSHVG